MRKTKENIVIITGLLICAILGLYAIYLSNDLSDDILTAAKLRKDIAIITEENALLKAEILQLSSYRTIATRAAEFGFKEATEYIYIGR